MQVLKHIQIVLEWIFSSRKTFNNPRVKKNLKPDLVWNVHLCDKSYEGKKKKLLFLHFYLEMHATYYIENEYLFILKCNSFQRFLFE